MAPGALRGPRHAATIPAVLRTRWLLPLALLLVAALPVVAAGHAVLLSSQPAAEARLAESPPSLRLEFSEPVQLVSPTDFDVVDEAGRRVAPRLGSVAPDDASALQIPLRPDLGEGTYTARYRIIGADSHVITGVLVFRIGPGALAEPFLEGAATASGPSETSAWSVSARFIELVMLGGLAGLLAFRWLVWRPAWSDITAAVGDRRAALTWGRDVFWIAFGVLALGAMLAEGYLLVVQSATVLGTSVADAVGDVPGLSEVLADTRFGSLLQIRAALLFVLFALGAWQFHREYGGSQGVREPTVAGRALPALALGGVLAVVLWQLSSQGHPSQAPLPVLQTGLHFVHIVAVAVWIAGLALVGLALWRLPRVAPVGGRVVGTAVLARFSRVALAVVGIAVATGVARAAGQLSDPAQLWDTAYGRSILIKLALLCPIAFLALRNRRIVTSLRLLKRPNAAGLTMVRRAAGAELALSLAVVVVASLLVAQVPGRI